MGSKSVAVLMVLSWSSILCAADSIRVGTFDIDATTPVGSPMAYDTAMGVQTPLSCRGVVIAGAGKPIVLCAVDWIGIANGGQVVFREKIAAAVDTEPQRVAIHTLHQHDAPRCDFAADALLRQHGGKNESFDVIHARDVAERAAKAARQALSAARVVTHYGLGSGTVEKVASNRRILGPDGKVLHTRWTATTDPEVRAFPVGTIDSQLKMISFWAGDEPLVALTYYATHPQSYYRTGLASPDFPGLARNARSDETSVLHVHFNGASGNVGAGKWNDGSVENRQVLADRVAAGMTRAWEETTKSPLTSEQVAWETESVVLPPADYLREGELLAKIQDDALSAGERYSAATRLVWLRRCAAEDGIPIGCLTVGNSRTLYMPGELFVEYQLAAQALRKDLFIAMAAYGDYAPWYIGTDIAYTQGGYETSDRASNVRSGVEPVLMDAINKLLK